MAEKLGNLHTLEIFGQSIPNPVYCRSCKFRIGEPPFADDPMKASCLIYPNPETKPNDVYFEGEFCEYYEDEK